RRRPPPTLRRGASAGAGGRVRSRCAATVLGTDPPMALELTTVGDDFAVVHDGIWVRRFEGLVPDSEHHFDGLEFRTLARPPGDLLCRFATVNDVHFGEEECGILDASHPDKGPVLSTGPGQPTHPDL